MTSKDYLVEKLLSGPEIWNQWRAENPQPDELDLREVNLSGADLRGIDLNQASLIGANLSEADLSEAKLYAACLREANLRGATLKGATLNGAFFVKADLRNTILRNANLQGTSLDKARTSDTDFEGAKYSFDTVLPVLSRLQLQSMILVQEPLQPDNQEFLVDLDSLQDQRKRTNVFRVSRKDQQKFRDRLIDAYHKKCAISQCDVESALDGAHIFPYRGPLTDCLWNGILLRLDLHRLFDAYLLTIDPVEGQVCLEESLMNSYGEYAFTQVCFPEQPISVNRQQALRWHNAQCSWFKSSKQ